SVGRVGFHAGRSTKLAEACAWTESNGSPSYTVVNRALNPMVASVSHINRGMLQGRLRFADLYHEGVGTAVEGGIESAHGGGEVDRRGEARHIDAADGVHGNPVTSIIVAAAQVSGVKQG